MCRERERMTTNHGKVELTRGGEKGTKLRGRVEEEVAAAPRGPGTVTMARTTDGMSLATSASGPTPRDDKVVLTGKPPIEFQPPRHESETTQPIRTPHDMGLSGEGRGVAMSHREAAGDEVKGGETNDEVRRAHKRVDDEDSRVETSEGKTTTATPRTPQSTPLEGEWIGKTSGGSSELTAPGMESASARSASCDHPLAAEDAEPRNPTRLPEDPGNATDDDARYPDKPTEPPDDAESTRVRGGEERVEERVEVDPGGGETDVE